MVGGWEGGWLGGRMGVSRSKGLSVETGERNKELASETGGRVAFPRDAAAHYRDGVS